MQKPTSWWRATIVRMLVPLYLVVIAGGPFALVAAAMRATRSPLAFYLVLAAAPAVYAIAYVLIAGTLSRLTIRAVMPGRYPRDVAHRVYGPRRLYSLCWTAIYYCAPIYHAVLAMPALKRLTLRLFGSVDFQTYPDTWLRDLPLLSIGTGAYLSNKATVSPNMCLRNGKIIVLPVSIGARTMIGHLTMIAPGVDIGADSEVGVGAALGVNACVGSHTLIDHEVILDHEAAVGDRCVIGTRSYVGRKAVIRSGLRVPPATVVPARAILTTQADVDALVRRTTDDEERPVVRLALSRGE
jgi:acetyltransferase-like isoleucine patch superfamily enzyme